MSEYDEDRQVPCSVCGAAIGDPCVDLDHVDRRPLPRGAIHIGRMTGGANLMVMRQEDGTFVEVEN